MQANPIETMPLEGEFLAETMNGDWLIVEPYIDPFNHNARAVINRRTGKWWHAKKWIEKPQDLEGEE